jgi:hypothetical protein
MSDAILERAPARSGELACVCESALPGEALETAPVTSRGALLPLAAANGFSVLAQALALATLPAAGLTLAPASWMASMPFVALLLGAGLATLPAAYLTTGWDRRYGFALGASMGLAGACMAAWGFATAHLPAMILGAFWMGVAQGFGAFYRHGAAQSGQARTIGLVIGSGALAAVLAPAIVGLAGAAGPMLPAALLLAAGAAQVAVLGADLMLPPPALSAARRPVPAQAKGRFTIATLGASLAWFAMAASMGASPLRMADCGIALDGQTGYIAWHLVAMYLPALGAGFLIRPSTRVPVLVAGVGAVLAALGVIAGASSGWQFAAGLVGAGIGWSMSMVSATSLLHADGTPPRALLALHDLAILAAAAAGAALPGLLH